MGQTKARKKKIKMKMTQVATIKEYPQTGELYLEFPEEMLKNLGWVENDTLIWSKNTDDTWSIRKKDDATLG